MCDAPQQQIPNTADTNMRAATQSLVARRNGVVMFVGAERKTERMLEFTLY